jgi:uncharacterized RDD family membrane protein YckC
MRGDGHRNGVAGAALLPARAAARAWRRSIEEALADAVVAPEVERVVDRALASSLPEEVARSLVRHRVAERIASQLVESGEVDRLVAATLASPHIAALTDQVLESELAERLVRRVASSPELRDALARQTTGLAEEVIVGLRSAALRLDDRAEEVVRRRHRERSVYAGIATRALALATDGALSAAIFMSVVGVSALVASLVGGLRPAWLVGALLACGWSLVAGTYFIVFWSTAGQTPGMKLLRLRVRTGTADGKPPSLGRSLVRFVGLVLAIVPFFIGFVPVLLTDRRRGLPDLLAGTVVVHAAEPSSRTSGPT